MKRVVWVLAALTLLAGHNASAQTAPKQDLDQLTKDAIKDGYWPYRRPGEDPVIRYTELRCYFPGFSKAKIMTGTEISDIWDQKKPKCTDKGLVELGDRLWARSALVLGSTNNPELRKEIGNMLAAGRYHTEDFESGSRKNTSLMSAGSVEPGRLSPGPFEPIGFTVHTIVLDPIKIPDGPNAGQWRSLGFTTYFTYDDGHDAAPCLNPFALFAEEPVTVTAAPIAEAAPAPAPKFVVPPQPPMENFLARKPEMNLETPPEKHGCKFIGMPCWVPIAIGAGAATAAIIYCTCRNHEQETQQQNNPLPATVPEPGKGATPLPPRPARVGFAFHF